MRIDLFEELAPVCPRCQHGEGAAHPLTIAEASQMRAGLLWHGILHCSNPACWMEFPVIHGVPILVADPPSFIAGASDYLLWTDDLPEVLESCLGDGFGPGHAFDTMRQHLSLYAGDHFCDWTDQAGESCVSTLFATGLDAVGETGGPTVDLGASVGRGVWELATHRPGPVLGGDLNISMLRLAQRLMLEGRASFPRRRIGMVYDRVEITLPADRISEQVDFWAIDALATPFPAGHFGLVSAINLVDCVPGPINLVHEISRLLPSGAASLIATPYDWSANATEAEQWLGGHSQRGQTGGAAEPVLSAALNQVGLSPIAEAHDVPWRLTLHARSVMHYQLHMLACRKAA